jgi:hypothetical protein
MENQKHIHFQHHLFYRKVLHLAAAKGMRGKIHKERQRVVQVPTAGGELASLLLYRLRVQTTKTKSQQ